MDFKKSDIFDLIEIIKFEQISYNQIKSKSEIIISKFKSFTEQINIPHFYDESIKIFLKSLEEKLDLQLIPQFSQPKKFTKSDWGPLIWGFLHHVSVLLQYSFYIGKIDNFMNFSTIVFNIDNLLICEICKSHYLNIKYSKEIEMIIKEISYGLPILGVFKLHNLINDNIKKFQNENKELITIFDFAEIYNCLPNTSEDLFLHTYAKAPCLFQKKLQSIFTKLTQNNIKEVMYDEELSYYYFKCLILNLDNLDDIKKDKYCEIFAQYINSLDSKYPERSYLENMLKFAQTPKTSV